MSLWLGKSDCITITIDMKLGVTKLAIQSRKKRKDVAYIIRLDVYGVSKISIFTIFFTKFAPFYFTIFNKRKCL